jgi:hypothetical protein
MPENPEKRARGRRRGFAAWAGGVDIANAVSLAVGVVAAILATTGPADDFLRISLWILAFVAILFLLGLRFLPLLVPEMNRERYQDWKLGRLAKRIEDGPPGVVEPLPWVKDPVGIAVKDLAERLGENKRLCVIMPPLDEILETQPGIPANRTPPSVLCQQVIGRISWQLAKAPGLGRSEAREVAEELLGAVRLTLQLPDQESMATLRDKVVRTLQKDRLVGHHRQFKLVPLAEVPDKGTLSTPAGEWLLDLFGNGLKCTFGLFYEEENDLVAGERPSDPDLEQPTARRYVRRVLGRLLSEEDVGGIVDALRAIAGDDMTLVRAHCAVIAAAAELGEDQQPRERLLEAAASARPSRDRERNRALAFRWLVGRKAARLTGTAHGVARVFDRLAVTGPVTREMFTELTRGLGLTEDGAGEFFGWLGRQEFRDGELMKRSENETGIRIGIDNAISEPALGWLRNRDPESYQDAQAAAERCYRVCLVLNRAQVPGFGYEAKTSGYGGLHLYETPEWWRNVHDWDGHAAAITAPERREDAGTAIVCLFLETWWWWGDQVRLSSVDKVLEMAGDIFTGRPGWLDALSEFDRNYIAQLDERAAAGDRWGHVASALGFISSRLHLRQGEIPDDPVLVRIYICWCFFSGDVAQQTGDLAAADGWFREAARACGHREDDAAKRVFARYQQADVWIATNPEQSLALIRQADLVVPGSAEETDLAGAGRALDDKSLLAYVARMYGDIRWESGDIDGAFDAYGRALLLAYVYQVDQESDSLPPNEYTRSLYKEMRTRLLQRLGEAGAGQHESGADAAIARIKALFTPYWAEAQPPGPSSVADPLAGVVPPLPDDEILRHRHSDYEETARLMLNDKLAGEIARPVDEPLAAAEAVSPARADS